MTAVSLSSPNHPTLSLELHGKTPRSGSEHPPSYLCAGESPAPAITDTAVQQVVLQTQGEANWCPMITYTVQQVVSLAGVMYNRHSATGCVISIRMYNA